MKNRDPVIPSLLHALKNPPQPRPQPIIIHQNTTTKMSVLYDINSVISFAINSVLYKKRSRYRPGRRVLQQARRIAGSLDRNDVTCPAGHRRQGDPQLPAKRVNPRQGGQKVAVGEAHGLRFGRDGHPGRGARNDGSRKRSGVLPSHGKRDTGLLPSGRRD